MRRKVIKQGRNTLTVTLPNKWVKEYNVKPGNEVEMTEKGNAISITTDKNNEELKTEIDISGLEIHTLWKYFMSVYREGYDKIKVKFKPDELYDHPFKYFVGYAPDKRYEKLEQAKPQETVQKMMPRFIGFEVIDQQKDYCIIEDMAEISTKEFDNSLRRVFLLIQQMNEEIFTAMKTNNPKLLEKTHEIDNNVDKFHDYCVRVLNRTGFKDVKKSHIIFAMLRLMELFGDECKHISQHLIYEVKSEKLDSCMIELAEKVKMMFDSFYEVYYNYSREGINKLSEYDTQMFEFFPELYKKAGKNKKLALIEIEIANHFKRMVRYLDALTELILEYEI